ncbi:MAG TPA: glycosyltransferase family 2 protein [Plantibacter sp.]|uniref:glycosyltransferase family 2 protein n=1 Tax=Plantibacter sp. TaxID=1871045 RepID=UPI002C92F2BC|nr:glycosyltransferase family 2 protein [Plantibacter sp.]
MPQASVDERVSVALCTYNGARFLEEQLDSILGQRVLPAEIVVSDDGSTDGSPEIVERIAAGAAVPIRLLRNPQPLGVTRNFESAMRATTGEFIVLCDQDDIWRVDRIERALRAFDARPQLQLVCSDARLVDGDGAPLGTGLFSSLSIGASERSEIAAGRAFRVLLRRNLVTGAAAMLRRAVFEAAAPFPAPWVHDEWLAIVAASLGPIEFLDEPLVDYRQHGANQIGVAEPTLRYKIRRLMAPGRQRNQDIADRMAGLAARLDRSDPPLPLADVDAVRAKLSFERFRADLPEARPSRVLPVLLRLRRGEYGRFASQGVLDIARDLLQPA